MASSHARFWTYSNKINYSLFLPLPHVIAFIAMALFLNLEPDHAST